MPASNPIRRIRSPLAALVAVAVAMWLTAPARAVIIQTVTGTDNTTAPADDPGFANVGRSTNGLGSAIYLGEGWVLTCNHVGGGGIVLASGTYLQKSGSGTGFSLATGTNYADLYMYQLETMPVGLPTLAIASAMPGVGTPVTMVGGGLDRGAYKEWLVDDTTDPWTWTVTGSNGDAAGYDTLGTKAIRWGTNEVSWNNLDVQEYWGGGPNDYYLIRSMVSDFDAAPGTTEAQAVLRDSGGAVFTKVAGQWQLAGVMYAVDGWSGQPNPISTAVFGDLTYMADLSYYRPQIVAVVPEPTAAALGGLAAAMLGAWRFLPRRRRR